MKIPIKVGVKFCGNCNPYIDTASLLKTIKNNYKDAEFVRWDEGGFSLLLILNACPVGCATHPDFAGPKIIITNESINYEPIPTEDLYGEILKSLGIYINYSSMRPCKLKTNL